MAKKLIEIPDDLNEIIKADATKKKTSGNKIILRLIIEHYAKMKK